MRTIQKKQIHKDIRLIGTLIRWIMPVFTKEQLVKLSAKCEQFLIGKWLGKHTTVETRYVDRPEGTKLRVLICRSKDSVTPNATGLLWIHGGGYAFGPIVAIKTMQPPVPLMDFLPQVGNLPAGGMSYINSQLNQVPKE